MHWDRRLLWVILFAMLALRLFIVFHAHPDRASMMIGDADSYYRYAVNILYNPHWLIQHDFGGAYREPGYPLLIALSFLIFGFDSFKVLFVLNALLGVLAGYLVYRFSLELFKNRWAALLAILWYGFNPMTLRFTAHILREELVYVLLLAFLFQLVLTFRRTHWKHWLLTSVFFVALIHTDARYLFYGPFLVILFWFMNGGWKGVKRYFVMASVVILLSLPWAVRNFVAYNGYFVLINERTIDTRPRGSQNAKMEYIRTGTSSFGVIHHTKNPEFPSPEERALIRKGENPSNRSSEEIALIRANQMPDSTWFGRKLFWGCELWRVYHIHAQYFPYPDTRFANPWSLNHNISSIVFYGLALPFYLIGLWLLYRERRPEFHLFAFIPVVHTLLHLMTHGRDRYRHPIESILIILASYVIVRIIQHYFNRRKEYVANNSNPVL
jgi:hypothetical protein